VSDQLASYLLTFQQLSEPYLYKKNPLTDWLGAMSDTPVAPPTSGTEAIPGATARYAYPLVSQAGNTPYLPSQVREEFYFNKIAILTGTLTTCIPTIFPN
jgi:hypothetical protein